MAISGFLVAAGTGLFGRGFRGVGRLAGLAGLIQRATVVIGWGSLSLLAMRLLRGGPRRSPVAPV